jgi:chromosome segregation ATPase
VLVRECKYCGKPIARRKQKGGREREYCNDSCRQLAYQARHPEKRYVTRIMKRIQRDRWKEDPRLMPWQEELEAAHRQIQQLKSDRLHLEQENSLLSWDLHERDREIHHLSFKLAEAEGEIARLKVLLDSQSKRKR